jgi:hypothetical protein
MDYLFSLIRRIFRYCSESCRMCHLGLLRLSTVRRQIVGAPLLDLARVKLVKGSEIHKEPIFVYSLVRRSIKREKSKILTLFILLYLISKMAAPNSGDPPSESTFSHAPAGHYTDGTGCDEVCSAVIALYECKRRLTLLVCGRKYSVKCSAGSSLNHPRVSAPWRVIPEVSIWRCCFKRISSFHWADRVP